MADTNSIDRFAQAVEAGIRSEIETIIAEEAEVASARVASRLRDLTPQLVMRLSRHYDIARATDHIVITVRDLTPIDASPAHSAP